jgi:hypothetical protein
MCGVLGIAGCQSKSSDDDSSGTSTTEITTDETGGDEGSGTTVEPVGFPEQPAPFTLALSGASSASLTFDTPSCSHRTGSATFRQFWRGSGHVYVLVVEMFDTFPGEVGAYTADDGVRTRLQEEAGGMGAYYDSTIDGVGASLTLDGLDVAANEAWGSATMGSMGDGAGGTVTVSPDAIPVWCDSME